MCCDSAHPCKLVCRACSAAVEMVSIALGGGLRRLAQLAAQCCSIGLVPHVGVAEVLSHTLQQGILFHKQMGGGGGGAEGFLRALRDLLFQCTTTASSRT